MGAVHGSRWGVLVGGLDVAVSTPERVISRVRGRTHWDVLLAAQREHRQSGPVGAMAISGAERCAELGDRIVTVFG